MIFVSGIHGVGKNYLCNKLKETTGIRHYSASEIISTQKEKSFSANKLVENIDENQECLLPVVEYLKTKCNLFLLDGHFCLTNDSGVIQRVPLKVFESLAPEAIILLTAEPEVIAERRKKRDGISLDLNNLKDFQNMEIEYAKEVAQRLNIPLILSKC